MTLFYLWNDVIWVDTRNFRLNFIIYFLNGIFVDFLESNEAIAVGVQVGKLVLDGGLLDLPGHTVGRELGLELSQVNFLVLWEK